MPRNETKSALLRQWEILKLLPSCGAGKKALELTKALNEAGFGISKRSVERDLNTLMESFPLERNDKSVPGGWKWVKGASAGLPGLTLAEALSLRLIEDTMKQLLPASMLEALEARFRQAENKLAALGKETRKAQWAAKVRTVAPALPLIPPKLDPGILETVQEALLADEQIEAGYRAMNDEKVEMLRLHPLGLVNRGVVTYLVATAFDYDDVRTYALHRLTSASRTGLPVKRPAGFDLDQYIKKGGLHFGTGRTIRLSARVQEWLARILEETPMSEDQKLKADGNRTRLTATVADSWQLQWWLLSQGNSIEVISPVALRRRIAGLLAEAAELYKNPGRDAARAH